MSRCWLDFPSSYIGTRHYGMKSEQQFVIMLAVPVRRVGRTSVTVGAGLDTGIVEGNPPSFMPFRQASPESRGLFLPRLCAAALVGSPRHGIYHGTVYIHFFLPLFFLSLARHEHNRSGGPSQNVFLSFRPLSHARFARFVVRETHTDAQTRQAFFSVRIGVLTSSGLEKKEGLAAKERPCAPERCCLLIRSLSET